MNENYKTKLADAGNCLAVLPVWVRFKAEAIPPIAFRSSRSSRVNLF